ncbi:MAG: hypothetical protein Q9218_000385 [Villophora microphyllina]
MESSRIFVRGLPPNMNAGQFSQHFSKQSSITDARLIPHRRIGYVGYKSPEDAMKAIEQEDTLKQQRHPRNASSHITRHNDEHPSEDSKISLKRKRDDKPHPENDSKLQEYLHVMQPTSKSRTWANEDPSKFKPEQQDVAVEDESEYVDTMPVNGAADSEYQEVPHKQMARHQEDPKHTLPTPAKIALSETVPSNPGPDSTAETGTRMDIGGLAATDDDWLRSRTSRLLGLVDDDVEDLATHKATVDAVEVPQNEVPGVEGFRPRSPSAATEMDNKDVQHAKSEALLPDYESNATAATTDRLFVRNLPYTTTSDDLQQYFESRGRGHIVEVHLPIDHRSGRNKGFAYIQYSDTEAAMEPLRDLDGKPFQGRLLHIIPSAAKRQPGLDDIAISKLPLKKQQQIKRKAEAASSTFNWNSMYMNADAVMSSISDRLGMSKSELLDPTSADAAVKQAHAETHIIQETKSYFSANGVDLDAFRRKQKGNTAILIKNFSYGTKPEELRTLFESYGTIRKLLMPPSGTTAIVDYVQADHARSAFGNLAYRKFKESVLFLEKAPKDLFSAASVPVADGDVASGGARSAKQSGADLLEDTGVQRPVTTSTLFVRNLNFSTTSERLREVFKPLDGFLSARVKTKPDPKNAGHLLSMGFGFLEFRSKEQAQAALAAMDGHSLDNHELLIRASHKGVDAAEERRQEDNAKKVAGRKTKIIIKNLPFEASKKDIRSLFSAYGQLRSVRVPKKFDSSTRGFAFAEFITVREAENAMDALKDTHLLGRRLVLDFAAEDEVDPEQEIARMQQKAGKQANKVALQRLTGPGRKKFNVEGDEDIDRG